MGMEKVTVSGVEPDGIGEESARRGLSESLGTSNIAINHYRVAPGEGLPGGLHAHMDQEEVFAVIEGEATFETMDGDITVNEGEVIRFAPKEFQSGVNESDGLLVVLAIGAPRSTEDVRIPVDCPECGDSTLRLNSNETDVVFLCPNCDTTHIPRDCPQCGHPDLRVTLNETNCIVAICSDCGTEFDRPPLRN